MGVMDKFMGIFQLTDDEDEMLDDEGDLGMDEPVRKPALSDRESAPNPGASQQPEAASKRAVPRFVGSKGRGRNDGNEVCVIKPTTVDETREITDTLLANRTVVLNLEGLDVEIAQRIIDFTSGSCYAMGGNLQKISHYIFIVTPASVNISGDFQELVNSAIDSPLMSGGLH